jgi:hypothetical protein
VEIGITDHIWTIGKLIDEALAAIARLFPPAGR